MLDWLNVHRRALMPAHFFIVPYCVVGEGQALSLYNASGTVAGSDEDREAVGQTVRLHKPDMEESDSSPLAHAITQSQFVALVRDVLSMQFGKELEEDGYNSDQREPGVRGGGALVGVR